MHYNSQILLVHRSQEIYPKYNYDTMKIIFKYLTRIHVFPTLPSPTTTNFIDILLLLLFCIFYKKKNTIKKKIILKKKRSLF